MTRAEIQTIFNTYLAGEMLSWREIVPHLNYALDDVNTHLNTCFPDFTFDTEDYTYFPTKYIRSTVILGAVWHFYLVDEEGAPLAQQFQMDFNKNLYYMMRDYSCQIPEEYNADAQQGTVPSEYEDQQGKRGMFINFNTFHI